MTELVGFEAEDHTWQVDAAVEAWVRQVLAPRARAIEELPGAEVVKQNRVRTVVRTPGPAGHLYCKRFRVVRPFDRLASAVKRSPARREWEAMRRLTAAGIVCPRPLVLGEERRGGLLAGSVLATQEAAGWRELTVELDARRADPARADDRRALAASLAELCRRIFDAGADHPDLHLANFLIDDGGALLTLDLHSVRLRRAPLASGRRLRRLGKLAHSFGPTNPDTEAWAREEVAWLAEATAALEPDLGPAERLTGQLLGLARRQEAARLASRDRRCVVTSTGYVRQGVRGRRMYRRREVTAQAVWLALDAPALAVVHAHPRGRSRIETLEAPPTLDADGAVIVRKLYLFPRLATRLAGVAGDSLALRAWKAARACEVRGIPTPRHYALVVEGAVPRLATILMERIQDATMIHVWLQEGAPSPAARRRLARDAGRLLGRFHGAGLKHHDLAVQNLLIRPRGGEGRDGWDLWVIDLDEVRPGAMSRREKLRALSQLADLPPQATRSDRLRFFRAYLAAGGREVLAPELEAWGERGLGRRVGELLAAKAEAKARRQARGVARPRPTDVGALKGT